MPFLYRTDTGLEVKLDGALSLTSIRATSTYVCLVANVVGSAVARSTVSLGTRYVYIFYLFTYYKQTKRFLWLCTLKVLSVSGQFDKVIRFLHFVESTYRAKEEFAQTLTCMHACLFSRLVHIYDKDEKTFYKCLLHVCKTYKMSLREEGSLINEFI